MIFNLFLQLFVYRALIKPWSVVGTQLAGPAVKWPGHVFTPAPPRPPVSLPQPTLPVGLRPQNYRNNLDVA